MTRLSSQHVRIRKPCACTGCNRLMLPGSPMVKETMKRDGMIEENAWCEVCQAYIDEYMDEPEWFIETGEFRENAYRADDWEAIRLRIEGEAKWNQ